MPNGDEVGKYNPDWCHEKHQKIDEEHKNLWTTVMSNDKKQTDQYNNLLYLMIANLGTLAGGLIVLLFKISADGGIA